MEIKSEHRKAAGGSKRRPNHRTLRRRRRTGDDHRSADDDGCRRKNQYGSHDGTGRKRRGAHLDHHGRSGVLTKERNGVSGHR